MADPHAQPAAQSTAAQSTARPAHPTGKKPGFNETAAAIIGSLVVGAVLATLLTGNPLRALSLAYLDYSQTPVSPDVPKASDTRAPGNKSDTR